jgi:hypothetical protein
MTTKLTASHRSTNLSIDGHRTMFGVAVLNSPCLAKRTRRTPIVYLPPNISMPNPPLIFSGSVEPTLEIPVCFTEHKEVYAGPDMNLCESVSQLSSIPETSARMIRSSTLKDISLSLWSDFLHTLSR